MNITILIDGSEEYGLSRVLLNLADEMHDQTVGFLSLSDGPFATALAARGYRVTSLAQAKPPPAFARGAISKIVDLGKLKLYNRRVAKVVSDAITPGTTDLVVVNYVPHIDLLTMHGVAKIWLIHNDVSSHYPFDLNRRMIRHSLRTKAVTPLANSQYIASRVAAPGFPVRVNHLGVDTGLFRPDRPDAKTRAQLSIPADATVFGIFARLVPEKGQELFLRALADPRFKPHHPHLLLLGGLPVDQAGSDYVAGLRTIAASAGMADALHLVGSVNDPECYYTIVDVAVNARVGAEPFGLSIVEAMAAGRPVLANRQGGPSEIIIPGETGWLAADASLQHFTDAIAAALQDKPRWPQMGRAAHARASAVFERGHAARAFLAIAASLTPS